VNINPDKNTKTFDVSCSSCGKMWKVKTCLGETTYEEVKDQQKQIDELKRRLDK